ncbi:hypothetical protein ES288_D11G352000v1 [Gossypium darwinii]|uniref:Uncharacterized protein n=1 Tax=Gossypium darwinii TaxID=34276 RepID=A0A5D2ARR1_GOSDA|nr:hypothetical protein ES288_D11G352000v1 [Gossypium darwinii]
MITIHNSSRKNCFFLFCFSLKSSPFNSDSDATQQGHQWRGTTVFRRYEGRGRNASWVETVATTWVVRHRGWMLKLLGFFIFSFRLIWGLRKI